MANVDLDPFHSDNSGLFRVESPIPEVTKNEPCCLGIDEAGRGPVLGPMVYGIAFCPLSAKDRLKELEFADSKTLTEEKRDELLQVVQECHFLGWATEIISPNYISVTMQRRSRSSLNEISHNSAIGLIQYALDQDVQLSEVYVDTVGDAGKYEQKLSALFPGIKITVSAKADAKFPIVSAASICAKVVRDHVLKSWKFTEGLSFTAEEFGSGYPSDPQTKKWLETAVQSVFGFPQLVRFSWSTCSKLLESKAASVHWEDDDDEEECAKNTVKLTQFFHTPGSRPTAKPHRFFEERLLHPIDCL